MITGTSLSPFPLKATFPDEIIENRGIQIIIQANEHAMDVSEVLLSASFPEKFEFTSNDILGGCDLKGVVIDRSFMDMGETPDVEGVVPYEIEIGFESRFMMNEIAVAALRSLYFFHNDFPGRAVETSRRKRIDEGIELVRHEPNNNVDIIGEAWLSVVNGSNTTTDHVANPVLAEGISEEKKWLSLRHW